MTEHGLECPEIKGKTEQNTAQNPQLAPERIKSCQEDEMTKRGQKRKCIDQTIDTSKLLKVTVADETEIQTYIDGHSEIYEDRTTSDKTVEQENIVTYARNSDIKVACSKPPTNDTKHTVLEETERSEYDVHTEMNQTLTEIKTNNADNEVMHSFDTYPDASKERNTQPISDHKDTAEITERKAQSKESLLVVFPSQQTTVSTNSVSEPAKTHQLEPLDKNRADIATLNEAGIVSPDSSICGVTAKDNIVDVKTGLESNDTLDIEKDTTSDKLKQDNIFEVTVVSSDTVTEVMHTEIQTKMTCHIELDQEVSRSETDTSAKVNSSSTEISAAEIGNAGACDPEKYNEIPATKDTIDREPPAKDTIDREPPAKDTIDSERPAKGTIEREAPTKDTTKREAPVKDTIEREAPAKDTIEREAPIKDKIEREAPAKDSIEREAPAKDTIDREAPAKDTIDREAPAKDTIDRDASEKEMDEVDQHEEDTDLVQSQPVSHTYEDIFLQSTDPVNTESNDSKQDTEGIETEAGEGLDIDFEIVAPRSPSTTLQLTREEVVFQSPRTAAESPEMLGNITDNPSPGTAAEAPEMLGNIMDDPSPKTAAEAPEMPADIGDDLTDSQFCAMDWSSQFQQESGLSLQLNVKSSLPPQTAGSASLQPSARWKPEDGTAIMRGLIREISQLNKMILKTKREMETVRHQRQQTYKLNRR